VLLLLLLPGGRCTKCVVLWLRSDAQGPLCWRRVAAWHSTCVSGTTNVQMCSESEQSIKACHEDCGSCVAMAFFGEDWSVQRSWDEGRSVGSSTQARTMCRVGQNQHDVYMAFLAGKSPNIRPFMVCLYGSSQP
jgi:hypothetical protein